MASTTKKSTTKKFSSKDLSKNAKISQAQQYTLAAVFGAAALLGIAIAVAAHFSEQIEHNAKVVAAADQSIVDFSEAIKNAGICPAPSNNAKVYNDEDLKKCSPNSVEISEVPGTLRSNILQGIASNEALNSVPKIESAACINIDTGKYYTYDEMQAIYDAASTSEELVAATGLIQECSALRVIPDALPDKFNDTALLSGLERIFDLSGWQHESLRPTGVSGAATFDPNLQSIAVQFSIDSSYSTAMTVLKNMERSIRELNVSRATIEWSGENSIELNIQAAAYYISPSTYTESKVTIPGGSK